MPRYAGRKRRSGGAYVAAAAKRRAIARRRRRFINRYKVFRPRKGKRVSRFTKKVMHVVGKMKELKWTQLAQNATPTIYNTTPNGSFQSMYNVPEGYIMDLIPQGDGAGQRDCDSVYARFIRLGGQLLLGDSTNWVRIIVLRAHRNYFTPTTGEVNNIQLSSRLFETRNAGAGAERGELIRQVYFDKLYRLDANRTFVSLPKYIKINTKLQFTSSANDSGADHIGVVFLSDSSAGPNPGVLYMPDQVFRMYYNDD